MNDRNYDYYYYTLIPYVDNLVRDHVRVIYGDRIIDLDCLSIDELIDYTTMYARYTTHVDRNALEALLDERLTVLEEEAQEDGEPEIPEGRRIYRDPINGELTWQRAV